MRTIAEIREKFPQYSDLSDSQLADALYKKYYADLPRNEFDSKIGLKPAPVAPQTDRTWFEAFKDVPASALTGVGGLLQFPGQLTQLVPGLSGVGQAMQKPGEYIQEFGKDLKSTGLRAREALRSQAISEAEKDGFLSEFATAITSTIKDPALIVSFVTEQVPLLLGPAGAARLATKLGISGVEAAGAAAAKGLTGAAAEVASKEAVEAAAEKLGKRATAAAIGTGTAMQAGDVGSDTYKEAYKRAIEMGMSPQEAESAALNAARIGAGGAALTSLGANLGLSKIGGTAIERALAGRPGQGRIKGFVGESISEGAEEGLGKVSSNIGMRTVDPSQSLMQGVGSATGMGVLGGGLFGTILSPSTPENLAPGQRPGESLYQTATRLNKEIKNIEDLAQMSEKGTVPPSGVRDIGQLFDLASTPADQGGGYAGVQKYLQTLNDMPASTERDQAISDAKQLLNRMNIESTERQTQTQTNNVITAKDLQTLGFKYTDPIYKELLGKNIGKPDDAQAAITSIENALQAKGLRQTQASRLAVLRQAIDLYLETVPGGGFYAQPSIDTTGGDGAGVAGVSGAGAAPAGVGVTEPSGVVPPRQDAEPIVGGKAKPTAPITEEGIKPQEAPVVEEVKPKTPKELLESATDAELQEATLMIGANEVSFLPASEILAEIDRRKAAAAPAEKKFTVTSSVSYLPKDLLGAKPRYAYGDKQFQLQFGSDIDKALYITAQKTPSKRDADYRSWLVKQGFTPEQITTGGQQVREAIKTVAKDSDPAAGPIKLAETVKKPKPAKKSLRAEPLTEQDLTDMGVRKTAPAFKKLVGKTVEEGRAELDKYRSLPDRYVSPETKRKIAKALGEEVQEAAPEPAAEEKKTPAKETTQKDLLMLRRAELITQLEGVMKKILAKYNLKGITLNLEEGMKDEGSYSGQIIKIALDLENPVRVLRHESIHALKDMGFFSDAQWNTLVQKAQDEWVQKYLKDKPHTDTQSRYDAYTELMTKQDLSKGEIEEALIEEAIADAFGDFDVNGAPAGLMTSILRRMKNLFKAIKEAFGIAGIDTAEEIFGKIEKGSLKPAIPRQKEKTDEQLRPREPAVRPSVRGEKVGGESRQEVRPERAGDGRGRDQGRSLAPLAGAPNVQGATGPDPSIVAVAEKYAKDFGIPYERQKEYVEVDEDRSRRIADAYESMVHAPQDPDVKEAYADMIRQTKDQYAALVDAGYEFTFFDSNTDPYSGNPMNAMRDLRKNKRMAVYGTYDGYGTDGITGAAVEDNPMLEDTGLRWPDQNGVERMVTANDLFRAVHDAFGHGIEGSGFRARGEENAWLAHAKLFTGPAVGAITSETRGQNSWLNYGPYGEKNRTAKLEDTVFAEQKTGLMPEWTWKEGGPQEQKKYSLRGEGIVLGKKQPEAQSFSGVHYGTKKLDELSGSKYGTGIKGAERRRLENSFDDRIKKRVYFYIPKEDGTMPMPEAGLGEYVYEQNFDNILGPGKEMSRLFGNAMGDSNNFESEVIDAGYDGYAVPSMGMMVILNHNVPVNYIGPRSEVGVVKLSIARPKTEAFKNWFGDSDAVDNDGNPLIVYTATNKDFTVFEPGRGPSKDAISAWVTSDKDFVNNYASVKFRWWKTMHRPWEEDRMVPSGVNIIPAYVNPKNPFDVTSLINDLSAPINDVEAEKIAKKLKVSKDKLLDAIPEKDVYPNGFEREHTKISSDLVRTRVAVDAMRRLGFDSVKAREAGSVVYALFESDQIKSAISNVGTYSGPDIRYSLRSESPEFKFWFGQSKIVDKDGKPKVMYHGLAKDTTDFTRKTARGAPIFLTDDPEFAGGFAKDSYESIARNPQEFLSKEQIDAGVKRAIAAIRKDYGKDSFGQGMIDSLKTGSLKSAFPEALEYVQKEFINLLPTGPHIMPLYVKADYPFDYENPSHIRRVLAELTEDAYDPADIRSGSWESIENADFQDAIQNSGFDSFYVKEQGKKNLAVYSPTQIKSATGNIGTYEPTSPDIRKSLRSTLPPSFVKSMDKIAPPRYEPSYAERITSAVSGDTYTRIRQKVVNRYERLAEYDRRVAAQIKQMGGIEQLADSKAESAALFSDLSAGILESVMGVHDRVGGAPIFKNGVTSVSNYGGAVKGLIEIFRPIAELKSKEAFNSYQTWAAVKRGVRLNAEGREDLIDAADVQAVKDLNKSNPDLVKLFESVQKDWLAYNNALVKYMKDTGVISPEMAKKYTEHGDYFPFYRLINEEDVAGPKAFSSIGNVKPPRKLKGGENPLGDFFENIVRNSQAAIQAGMKNTAAQRATEQAMRLGEVTRLAKKEAGVNVYRVFENGKEVYYRSHDPLFIEAIKSLNMAELPFIGLLAKPAAILRNLVTKDPAFMLANMMRDSLSAWATTGVKMTPIFSTFKNFGSALAGQSPEMSELYAHGILGGYDYSTGSKDAAREFEAGLRKRAGNRTAFEIGVSPATSLWGALEKGTQASDAATRIEVYKKVLAETGNEAEALWRALEVMNFNRRGNAPIVRIMTAAIPFLNARMQGLDVLWRSAVYPAFGTDTDQAKQRMKTFWVRGMTLLALSSMYWLMTHDDEEYKKQEQEVRDNNWLIPSLGIKIPIPFEVGVLFKVVPERIMNLWFGTDTSKDFTDSMKRQFVSTFGFNPIPQLVLPAYEAKTNYSFFTDRPIIGKGLENVQDKYQIGPSTSRVAQMIGSSVGYSPMKLDHLIKGYTGTIGTYFTDLVDVMYDMNSSSPKPSKRFEQMPVIKRFALDPDARGTVTQYYKLKDDVDSAVRTANMLDRANNFSEYTKYSIENRKLLASKEYINSIENDMKDYRDMKLQIQSAPFSAETKKNLLLAISRMESQTSRNIQTIKKFSQP